MLQNASLLAIVAVHTAENEPSKVGDAMLAVVERRVPPNSLAHFEGLVLGCIDEFLSFVFSSEELSTRSVCSAL